MSRSARWAVAAGILAVAAAGSAATARPPVIVVRSGHSVGDVVRSAARGSHIVLGPGTHAGFHIDKPVAIRGAAGARVRGTIVISASGAHLSRVHVAAADNGVSVAGAERVSIEDVTVTGATLHGIEVVEGSARISGCRVRALGPYGQGVEIRNTNGHPRSVVERCSVSSGYEGVAAHASRLEIRDTHVRGTTGNAIAVSEMSEAVVERNTVTDVVGVGIYCGDSSHCEVRDNRVARVSADPSGAKTRAGYAVVASYRALIRERGTAVSDARRMATFLYATETGEWPLGLWPRGWRGALPAAVATGAALALLAAGSAAAAPLARRRRARGVGTAPVAVRAFAAAAVAVQGFHMVEHVVQVFQVYVADAERRSGVLGHRVDSEWLHFAYNAAALLSIVVIAAAVWRWGGAPRATGVVLAAAAIQTYHLVEHVAKVVQHTGTGVRVAPGLLGARAGLVLFHYAINLAVFAGVVVGGATLVRARRSKRSGSTA